MIPIFKIQPKIAFNNQLVAMGITESCNPLPFCNPKIEKLIIRKEEGSDIPGFGEPPRVDAYG